MKIPLSKLAYARSGDKGDGSNVGVVVTDRRALGLSPFVGGFFAIRLDIGDHIEAVSADSNLVTLTGVKRVLIFRATTGTWEERRRGLR